MKIETRVEFLQPTAYRLQPIDHSQAQNYFFTHLAKITAFVVLGNAWLVGWMATLYRLAKGRVLSGAATFWIATPFLERQKCNPI